MHILLIEDDPDTARHVSNGLKEAGHVVDIADNGSDGLALASNEAYDVLVIDRMLPAMDGLSVVSQLRDADNPVPVLILSALGDVDDRIAGLKAGGDDYLAKPFAFGELQARIEALARRASQRTAVTQLRVAELEMDVLARRVRGRVECRQPVA